MCVSRPINVCQVPLLCVKTCYCVSRSVNVCQCLLLCVKACCCVSRSVRRRCSPTCLEDLKQVCLLVGGLQCSAVQAVGVEMLLSILGGCVEWDWCVKKKRRTGKH